MFYRIIQAKCKDRLLGMHVFGVIIWASYDVALFQVGSSLLNSILWALRMCSVVYLGLVVHEREPVQLRGDP